MRLVGCQTWLRSFAVPRRWIYSSYSDANPGLLRHPPFNLASSPHSAAPRHEGGLLIAPRPRMSDKFYSFLSETVPEDSTLVFDGRSRILIPAATVVVTSAEAHHTPRPIAIRRQNRLPVWSPMPVSKPARLRTRTITTGRNSPNTTDHVSTRCKIEDMNCQTLAALRDSSADAEQVMICTEQTDL